MTFQTVKEITDAVKPAASVLSDRVSVTNPGAVTGDLVDRLVRTSVFGQDAELKGTARWILRSLAAAAGIRPASIHDLYLAMGRGDAGGFTVPAINVRAMSYETARAVIRAAKTVNAGAFIFEIARSEIGYTEQRPHEYAAVVLGAALREGFSGPLFIQGDHVQTNAKKYNSPDRDKELEGLRALIKEEIAAGFYNIDIDTSTLVDLDKATLPEQQEVNVNLAADFTAFIRQHEPQGVTVSVGGEIGEVGGKNSDVHELHAYMIGFNAALKQRGAGLVGLSKISVQTGTAHGGFINADGTLRMDVAIDLKTLEELSRLARLEYGLGGAVQHGASTLPPDAFDAFPRAGACEIHLATDFQNMIYEHPQFPADLKSEMYAWIREHALEERKPKDTEEQFIYKARKKAIGPFKPRMWNVSEEARRAIGQSLEERFSFLMKKLKIEETAAVVSRFVSVPQIPIDREAEVVAAGGKITAAEKKAEGLADWNHTTSCPPLGGPSRSVDCLRSPEGKPDTTYGETPRCLVRVFASSWLHLLLAPPRVPRTTPAAACPPRRPAGRDRDDLTRHIPRVHGRDGDAVRSERRGAHGRADAWRSRAVPPVGEGGPVVGRSDRGRLGRARRCRPAADPRHAGPRAGRLAGARVRADRSVRRHAGAVVAEGEGRGRDVHLLAVSVARLLPADDRELPCGAATVRRADGSGPCAADHQLRSEVRHAGDPGPLRDVAAGRRTGVALPHRRRRRHRARVQLVRHSVSGRRKG